VYSLNDMQLDALQQFLTLVNTADVELDETFSTGRMSDAKSAVFAVKTAAETLDLPDELARQLKQMAQDSWRGATGAEDVYGRAGNAIRAIGHIQTLIHSVLDANLQKKHE